MKRLVLGNIAMFLLTASTGRAEQPLQGPQLSADYTQRRDLVLPNSKEQSYRNIPWRASILQGIVDGQKNDKPIMIVLMNGHPLGCT